ncbi:hypothetical protein KSF_101730 [Reticulibacter mediterranei]|uniref:Uncharacterized protein n=1 Tax=Reticulibacter mediterranei TaxID=2778369 RepID=A0A8J3J0K1_9CHLR|nr:hypothetical protein [Reticulibacter mediterranei]GHP00126.1 hypothetical protein KSF_101730 [Reticulibacter mediterranei]
MSTFVFGKQKGEEHDASLVPHESEVKFTRFCEVREARASLHFTYLGHLASLQGLHAHRVTISVTQQLTYGELT